MSDNDYTTSILDELLKEPGLPLEVHQMSHLIHMVQSLGWSSFIDKSTIALNYPALHNYIKKNSHQISLLFGSEMTRKQNDDLINILNPFLVHILHLEIDGTSQVAKLTLLVKK